MSVRENLTLALLPHLARAGVVDREKQREVVDRFIRRLAIKCSSADQPIRELSGGNQQKVLLARWLCMNPRLLILDEPTRRIDVDAKAEIQSLIGQLASEGLGVLMISSENGKRFWKARIASSCSGRERPLRTSNENRAVDFLGTYLNFGHWGFRRARRCTENG
jgi:ABC-type uncharacterized transport system ATPase subunit